MQVNRRRFLRLGGEHGTKNRASFDQVPDLERHPGQTTSPRRRPSWWVLVQSGVQKLHARPLLYQVFLVALTVVGIALVVLASAVYSFVTRDLPPANQVFTAGMFQTAMIYDRKGRLLYEMVDPNGGRRDVVQIQDIPRSVVDATVMTEDANFYTNPGVDPLSILRAFVDDLRHHQIMSGASTITQQLVRNVIMTPEERQSHSIVRKLGEAILAYRISQRYSKDEILERYLNEIYYGNLAYGIEAASETYFAKPVQQLDLAQSALLAGLPQAPALYDPYQHPNAAKRRQQEVLSLMVKHGAISQSAADAAAAEPLHYHPLSTNLQAPHFVMYVRSLLDRQYSHTQLYQQGLHVYTSLDLDLQRKAEAAIQKDRAGLAAKGAKNAALVAIDPRNGEILAMVGSVDFNDATIQGQVNMATAPRLPGALIEPFTYVEAFDRGLAQPGSVLADSPVQYSMGSGRPPYQPRDADGKYRGPVTARRALANSLNIPAIGLLDRLGVVTLLDALHRFGFVSLNQPASFYGLGLTLGDAPVELLELTDAYATLANGGVQEGAPVPGATVNLDQRPPVAILKVTDARGKVLEAYQPGTGTRLVGERAAWLVNDVLQDDSARAETFGAHSALALTDRPAAVKTATSEELKNGWAVGYTPQLAVGVWAGNADGQPVKGAFGSTGPAIIWHDFLEAALRGQPVVPFNRPPGLVQATVDATTGLLPVPGRPTVTDWFMSGSVPTITAPRPAPTSVATPLPRPAARPAPPAHGRGNRRN